MNILLNVTYSADGYWAESSVKNKIIYVDEKKSIHDEIGAILLEKDYCILSYKNKPKGNVFIDIPGIKNISEPIVKIIGYMYRGKHEINIDGIYKTINFDVWVTLNEIIDFKIEEIEL